MLIALLAIIAGLVLLVWSADRFVEGAAATAKYAGMPSLLIGIIIVGFGTSAPEMVVSAMAAFDDNPDLALGNALGSNIVNIGLVLGITALIAPIVVQSSIIRKELPLLIVISGLVGWLMMDGHLTFADAVTLLIGFIILIVWAIVSALRNRSDSFATEISDILNEKLMPKKRAIFWLFVGLILLIISSRILVWGAVNIAQALGVSDLIIGLTIVALGTSLPELASSVIAARKGEHDIAIGNVVGSNMFNILAVVGIAGVISPMESVASEVMTRDWATMMGLTLVLFLMAYGFRGQGRVNRWEGMLLLLIFIAYNGYLMMSLV